MWFDSQSLHLIFQGVMMMRKVTYLLICTIFGCELYNTYDDPPQFDFISDYEIVKTKVCILIYFSFIRYFY